MKRAAFWSTALGFGALGFGVVASIAPQLAQAQATSAGAAQPTAPVVQTAQADPPPASQGDQVSEVIVTANRRAEALSRVGVSVTAVSSAALQRNDIQSPSDLARVVPSFHVTPSFGGNDSYTLRGVGFNSPNPTSESPVGVYLNEAAIPYTYMAQGLIFDLERVEVLKGPQGTQYGRATTGGLIDYVTAKPTKDFHYGGEIEGGSYATVNGSAYVSGPITDYLRVRLAVDSQNRFDGWQDSVTRDESLGKSHQQAIRLTADFSNGGPWDVSVLGTYWNKRADSLAPQATFYYYGGTPLANPLAAASIIAHPNSDTQADWLSKYHQPQAAQGIFQPGPLINSDFVGLITNASYQLNSHFKAVSLTDFDYLNHRDMGDNAGLQTESESQENRGWIRSISEEARLLADYGPLTGAAGLYYANDQTEETDLGFADENGTIEELRGLGLLVNGGRYPVSQVLTSFGNYLDKARQNTQVSAAFANGEYKFNSLLKLTGGVRYTKDITEFAGCTYDYKGGNVAVINLDYPILTGGGNFNLQPNQCYTLNAQKNAFVPIVTEKESQDNVSWRAVLDVTPTPTTLFYGSLSRGYKSGGFPVIAASVDTQFTPVKQEEIMAYEVGAKVSLFDHRLQLDGATFYYDYTNKQAYGRVADVIFGSLQLIRNVPKAREFGVEGDATWRLTRALTAVIAGDYLDSHIGSFQDFTQFGVPQNFDGAHFEFTPKYSGNASLIYDAPITSTYDLNASFSADYQDKSQSDFSTDPLFKLNSHTLLNATLGVAPLGGRWTAGLYVKNLLNTYYWTGAEYGIDSVYRYPGMPREIGARLTYRY